MGEDDKANVRVYTVNYSYFTKLSKIYIDSFIFKLHYRWTFILLVVFSILMTGKELFGDPIDCISKDDIPSSLLDTFCWIHSTFSLPNSWKKEVGEEVPYPGVDKYVPGEKKVYHAYYQWVCLVLFLQAVLFYFPWYLWKCIEGRRIRNLVFDLDSPIVKKESKESSLNVIAEYLIENNGKHYIYFFCNLLVHALNLLNVIGQIFLMNRFLGGAFTSYGIKVAQFTDWDWKVRYDPMIEVFPRLVKCTFFKYGSSGDIQKHDAMCIIPLNILGEKIYVFLWFWFVTLSILSGLDFCYRILCIKFVSLRNFESKLENDLVDSAYLNNVLKKTDIGSWLVLLLLEKNMHRVHFRDLIKLFSEKLSPQRAVQQVAIEMGTTELCPMNTGKKFDSDGSGKKESETIGQKADAVVKGADIDSIEKKRNISESSQSETATENSENEISPENTGTETVALLPKMD